MRHRYDCFVADRSELEVCAEPEIVTFPDSLTNVRERSRGTCGERWGRRTNPEAEGVGRVRRE